VHYTAPYTSPFALGNQGCTQPMYYGIHLSVIIPGFVCLIYWVFWTLNVPAGRFLRLLFLLAMIAAIVTGSVTSSWVSNDACCPTYYPSEGSATCTAPQLELKNALIGSSVVMILMGAWFAMFFPWVVVFFLVWGIFATAVAFILQSDYAPVWQYLAFARWLVWQKHEKDQDLALRSGAPNDTNYGAALTSVSGGHGGNHEGKRDLLSCDGDSIHAVRQQLQQEQAVSASLREQLVHVRQGGGNDEMLLLREEQLRQEQGITSALRAEVAKLKQENATLKSGKPAPYVAPYPAYAAPPQPAAQGYGAAPPSYNENAANPYEAPVTYGSVPIPDAYKTDKI